MRKLLEKANIKDLFDFFEESMKDDSKLASRFLARFAEPERDGALDRLKKEIDDTMDQAENCRDEWGNVVIDTYSVMHQIGEYTNQERYKLAFSGLEKVFQRLDGLLEMQEECEIDEEITFCIQEMEEIVDKVEASDNSDDKEFLFDRCLEMAIAGYGDGYGMDRSDDMLRICKRFVTQENRSKIEKVVETDLPLYLSIIKRLFGQKAVEDYFHAHMDNTETARIAYSEAMVKKDYVEAEKFLDAIILNKDPENKSLQDLYSLYSLHELTGSTSKMAAAAEKILSEGDASYYPKLKALLQASGEWEARRKSVLETCKSLKYKEYMDILEIEGELALLFEQLENHPDKIYRYGEALSKSYREEILQMFIENIRYLASVSKKKEEYCIVAKAIKVFSVSGYADEAKLLIAEIAQTYSRRPAFVRELATIK